MEALIVVVVVLFIAALLVASSSVRVLREYERGVVFRLGRLIELKDPGLLLLIPAVDRMERVDLRVVTLNVPAQDIITRDNVPVRVTAVAYFKVIDANRAIIDVENYYVATSEIAQTSLRAVLGKADLDTLLSEREQLNADLQQVIDQQTEPWGIKVSIVEIKDVDVPANMQRAIARQAEAERERRAKVINAQGEFQASKQLADAADVMSRNPATLQLRYLQTLVEIGASGNSSTVIPLPLDILTPLLGKLHGTDVGDTHDGTSAAGADAPVEDIDRSPRNGVPRLGV
ncbi:slipin family protein [Leekyejoonella antrihumi]|uniref:Slipin family protein n=1 Tax=Leekyejoonella antrihumi TaxID=1660198 RepID=A0A563E6M4_9MICO|nr:slipin family protein [Leekyejoonella antrihumi]TWP37861.1 slipin family protein [Leekyejoonella antrihumi]